VRVKRVFHVSVTLSPFFIGSTKVGRDAIENTAMEERYSCYSSKQFPFFSFARPVLGSVTSPGTIGMSQHTNVDVTRLRRTPTFHPRPGSLRWPENYPELLTRQSERATVGFGSLRNGKSPRGRPGYERLFVRSRRRASLTALANETNHAGYGPRTTHSYSTTRAYRFRAQLHLALRFD
jgi:hypothetical protein